MPFGPSSSRCRVDSVAGFGVVIHCQQVFIVRVLSSFALGRELRTILGRFFGAFTPRKETKKEKTKKAKTPHKSQSVKTKTIYHFVHF
jgi:hypothetical protein